MQVFKRMGVTTGLEGKERDAVLRFHRIEEFEKTWTGYLNGTCPAYLVKERAEKMFQLGMIEYLSTGRRR